LGVVGCELCRPLPPFLPPPTKSKPTFNGVQKESWGRTPDRINFPPERARTGPGAHSGFEKHPSIKYHDLPKKKKKKRAFKPTMGIERPKNTTPPEYGCFQAHKGGNPLDTLFVSKKKRVKPENGPPRPKLYTQPYE